MKKQVVKKSISFVIIFALLLGMSACKTNDNKKAKDNEVENPANQNEMSLAVDATFENTLRYSSNVVEAEFIGAEKRFMDVEYCRFKVIKQYKGSIDETFLVCKDVHTGYDTQKELGYEEGKKYLLVLDIDGTVYTEPTYYYPCSFFAEIGNVDTIKWRDEDVQQIMSHTDLKANTYDDFLSYVCDVIERYPDDDFWTERHVNSVLSDDINDIVSGAELIAKIRFVEKGDEMWCNEYTSLICFEIIEIYKGEPAIGGEKRIIDGEEVYVYLSRFFNDDISFEKGEECICALNSVNCYIARNAVLTSHYSEEEINEALALINQE